MIHYLSKIYFKIFFCQFFEYGIFILISALKLFNSKKNLPCVFERLTFEWRKKEYFRVEWSSPCHGNQQEFRYTCIRSDTLFRRKSPRRCVSSAICGCSESGCSEESQWSSWPVASGSGMWRHSSRPDFPSGTRWAIWACSCRSKGFVPGVWSLTRK